MSTRLEAARRFTCYVARFRSNGGGHFKETTMAKLLAAQVAFRVANGAIQVFRGATDI